MAIDQLTERFNQTRKRPKDSHDTIGVLRQALSAGWAHQTLAAGEPVLAQLRARHFFDGNYQEYEADKRKRLGEEGAKAKRIRFKALKQGAGHASSTRDAHDCRAQDL